MPALSSRSPMFCPPMAIVPAAVFPSSVLEQMS
jgi:hypothetical protein